MVANALVEVIGAHSNMKFRVFNTYYSQSCLLCDHGVPWAAVGSNGGEFSEEYAEG